MTEAFCACGKQISPKTKSGRCLRCAAADPTARAKKGKLTPEQRERRAENARKLSADPAIVAKRTARMVSTHADPVFRKKHAAVCAAGKAERMLDPEFRAKLVEQGHKHGKKNLIASTPEQRKRAGDTKRRLMLAWCPEDLWPMNASLKRSGFRLDDRKRMIADHVAKKEAQRLAALSPFERQMERLRAGGKLVAKPDFTAAPHDFSLIGNATGML